MKSASDQTRWATVHALAHQIPALPEPEKCAAISLLLSKLLDLLRVAT